MEKEGASEIKKLKKEIRTFRSDIRRMKGQVTAATGEKDYFSLIFDNANDGIIIHDERGRIIDVNKTYCQRLGYEKTEMMAITLQDLVSVRFGKKIPQHLKRLREKGSAIFESEDRRKDGTCFPVEVNATCISYQGRAVIQSVVRDIHKRKLAEELIKATMEDNDKLLKEMRRQSRYTSEVFINILETLAVEIERGFRQRPLAAALKHQRIRAANIAYIQNMFYQSPDVALIDMEAPIKKLVPFNFRQMGINACRILSLVDAGGISLDLHRAVPCCLLIGEFLTNSLRHAFPKAMPGEIRIRLTQDPAGGYALTVADNGVGVPKDFSLRETPTLGMQLIKDLVRQLNGTIEVRRSRGTKFVVRFEKARPDA
jgi:PAS domain S-box-containing protein